ncbi:MAG TPA: sugar transferase [Terriglobales bacterium]|nr:sugar transferase [Terriglobales bacterium]
MNVRRAGDGSPHLSPLAPSSVSGQRSILNEDTFRRMISLERKRSERSRKPFVLMILDMGDHHPSENNRQALRKVAAALSETARETDLTGWYSSDCAVGVMFTELGFADRSATLSTMITRVSNTLRATLIPEEFNQVSISFHVFPEDWDHEADRRPSNPTLYPDLAERDESKKIHRRTKRIMDVMGSLAALMLLSPVFLIIALAVKATSKGPILFRQRRIGQHGKSFTFLKFRSMYVGNDASIHREYVKQLIAGKAEKQSSNGNGAGVYKLTRDPRVTGIGAFLRKTSLDEIPQFFNVLRGEMSLVGPRPPVPYEVESYDFWHRRRVLEAKPGITGLWQIKGRSRVKFDDMVRLDLQYARTWSPWLDVKILLQTPGAMVIGEGAH